MFPFFKSQKSRKINDEMFIIIDTSTQYFTSFYFQNIKKQKYLFIFLALRSSTYSTKIDVKWTIIMLQRSLIPIWNPQNQGYKIGYIYYWGQPWSPKTARKMLLRILSANTVYTYYQILFLPRPKVSFKTFYRCSSEQGVIFKNQKLSKTFVSEATESCKGSKWGFFGVPSTTRPFPDGLHV